MANWIEHQVRNRIVEPHDIAILIRMRANQIEELLAPAFTARGLRLRNVAKNVGEISIQDLLSEDLTGIFLPLLRLGATAKSPGDWSATQKNLQYLEAIETADEFRLQQLQQRLQKFVKELRRALRHLPPSPDSVTEITRMSLEFIGERHLHQAFPAYQRQQDFGRVWDGFVLLLQQCTSQADTWSRVLDEFEGLGQIALMTIHKSKGLEFHTMIFYGLDSQTWWSLTPGRPEELNTLFVALTRAEQRAFFTLCTQTGQPITWIENLLAPAGVRRIDGAALLLRPPGV